MSKKTQAEIETKLSAARTRLIMDNPFLGSLILQLPTKMTTEPWCPRIATDARYFYYNPDYIDSLNLSETQFVLSHEALHCGLSHFFRAQHRLKTKWDLACDYAVNALLKQENLQAPKGTAYLSEFENMSAEEIYPCIDDNDDSELLDEHLYQHNINDTEQSDEKPSMPNSPQQAELAQQWQKRMATAAQQAKMAGKLSENLSRWIDKLLKPEVSWRQLLANYMTMQCREDYSYARPSTRRDEGVIFPGIHSPGINIVVALDTSGSISKQELLGFVSELNAIKGQVRARITLLGCDKHIANENIFQFEPWDEINIPSFFTGGGGTLFSPVFNWINQQDVSPDLLVYFTDGKAPYPQQPAYPVLWMIKGKITPPWGQHIQLND